MRTRTGLVRSRPSPGSHGRSETSSGRLEAPAEAPPRRSPVFHSPATSSRAGSYGECRFARAAIARHAIRRANGPASKRRYDRKRPAPGCAVNSAEGSHQLVRAMQIAASSAAVRFAPDRGSASPHAPARRQNRVIVVAARGAHARDAKSRPRGRLLARRRCLLRH